MSPEYELTVIKLSPSHLYNLLTPEVFLWSFLLQKNWKNISHFHCSVKRKWKLAATKCVVVKVSLFCPFLRAIIILMYKLHLLLHLAAFTKVYENLLKHLTAFHRSAKQKWKLADTKWVLSFEVCSVTLPKSHQPLNLSNISDNSITFCTKVPVIASILKLTFPAFGNWLFLQEISLLPKKFFFYYFLKITLHLSSTLRLAGGDNHLFTYLWAVRPVILHMLQGHNFSLFFLYTCTQVPHVGLKWNIFLCSFIWPSCSSTEMRPKIDILPLSSKRSIIWLVSYDQKFVLILCVVFCLKHFSIW